MKSKLEKKVQFLTKDVFKCKLGELIKTYESAQETLLLHVLNIRHQYQEIRYLKNNLTDQDMLLHVDFSENYKCKFSSEPQAVHFGASRQQITLHTGVVYTSDFKQGFCTLSPSLRHDPEAIIAHLKPVLEKYLDKFKNVKNLHFLSDSPCTQYRNKTMFFLIANRLPFLFPKIEKITWNYSEAGHGKGAPDGIGGVLKRMADRVVAEGNDIKNLDVLFSCLVEKTNNLLLIKVDNNMIKNESDWIKHKLTDIQTVPGTLKVHQVC